MWEIVDRSGGVTVVQAGTAQDALRQAGSAKTGGAVAVRRRQQWNLTGF